ncbi:MAG: cob(I)yrinic acid a,c-diamide adenosyltransferase [Actinomycetota bacterium]
MEELDPTCATSSRDGILMVFTGEGWGKSAAAIGYSIRARGMGWATTMVQFLKGGSWNAAEISATERMGIDWPVLSSRLTWAPRDLRGLSDRAWEHAAGALEGPGPALVVLDELSHAIDGGWLDLGRVTSGLESRARQVSVIITGADVQDELCDLADTVTTFERSKHLAKKGVLGP